MQAKGNFGGLRPTASNELVLNFCSSCRFAQTFLWLTQVPDGKTLSESKPHALPRRFGERRRGRAGLLSGIMHTDFLQQKMRFASASRRLPVIAILSILISISAVAYS